jgi:hypothetical protein
MVAREEKEVNDERTTLLDRPAGVDGRAWARARRVVGGVSVVSVIVLGSVCAVKWSESARVGEDWKPASGKLLAPAPSGSSQSTYTLHTACKPRALSMAHDAFFLNGEKEAYLVKHNYGTSEFFREEDALKMTRQKLPSGNEYGYVLSTAAADFEYGFALKNGETDEWLYEIGGLDSPLAKANCTQKYGSYFNRVRTLETNKASIEYVFGDCTSNCENYVDEAYVMRISEENLIIPNCGVGTADLGPGDDARLFTLYSALFVLNDAAVGRSPTSRDTTYAESKTQARWFVQSLEYSDRNNIRVIAVDVTLQGERIHVCQSNKMHIPLQSQCTYIDCSSSIYDIPSMQSTAQSTSLSYSLTRLQYSIARVGDPRPAPGIIKFSNAKYLTDDVLYAAGTWGHDIDARRLIPISGGPCGQSIANGHCVGMYTVAPDSGFTATANEKRWILGTISGHMKMVRIRVYVQNGALKVAAIRAAYANSGYQSRQASATMGPLDRDPLRPGLDLNALWNSPVGSFSYAGSYSANGYGVGALKWMLAPEMSPSLAQS